MKEGQGERRLSEVTEISRVRFWMKNHNILGLFEGSSPYGHCKRVSKDLQVGGLWKLISRPDPYSVSQPHHFLVYHVFSLTASPFSEDRNRESTWP